MKRLQIFILLFLLALSIPMTYVIWQTFAGLQQEERAQLRYFAETMLDEMERELAELVQDEENRSVDEYGHTMSGSAVSNRQQLSPLAEQEYQPYIFGYLQNNPDGSFQTPEVADMGRVPVEQREKIARFQEVNSLFNKKKLQILPPVPGKSAIVAKEEGTQKEKRGFSERYLSKSKKVEQKSYLGKKQQRIEEITAEQAYNIASEDELVQQMRRNVQSGQVGSSALQEPGINNRSNSLKDITGVDEEEKTSSETFLQQKEVDGFQVEVAPFQSVSIDDNTVYVFRRIAINNQIYRQGFIIEVEKLLRHLVDAHFSSQPLSGYTELRLQRSDLGDGALPIRSGVLTPGGSLLSGRSFPAPFHFIGAAIESKFIPSSPARTSLNLALMVLGVVMIFGLLAIYQSARTIVKLSERRSQFVSSVTHELKTPLTNIRMYIEMLEQGIAATPEREQEYLAILGSESSRLSSLINNVLELAKLEKKQRQFHLQEGDLSEVLIDVQTLMGEKIKQEGFRLHVPSGDIPTFSYDREVMVQILVNLIENSIKFGRHLPTREITIKTMPHGGWVHLGVSDTGPGIPRFALKKIFNDFYRVDNDLTRKTGGTGIGLALIKKFVLAMGGRVSAANNQDSGCTISIFLPR